MTFSMEIMKSNTDEWYTPRECVELIVPYLLRGGYKKILCPFDKEDSQYVKVLTEYGFDVTYGHIDTGADFFKRTDLKEHDAIISNPPFSKREAILETLFKHRVPFGIILNMNGLFGSKARWKLFKDNEFELLIPSGRMKFYNENCKGKSPQFQSVYVCQGIIGKQIEFVELYQDRQIRMF